MSYKIQYMVVDKKGQLYAASNACTQASAKDRHYFDTGELWPQRYAKGDRIVKVKIEIWKTLP